jgi:hypothetical protein
MNLYVGLMKRLCCGRGYQTRWIDLEEKCNCRFVWCCHVQCDICKQRKELHLCNWWNGELINTVATRNAGLYRLASNNREYFYTALCTLEKYDDKNDEPPDIHTNYFEIIILYHQTFLFLQLPVPVFNLYFCVRNTFMTVLWYERLLRTWQAQ